MNGKFSTILKKPTVNHSTYPL